MPVQPTPPEPFDLSVDTLIIGAGAGGMMAALAANEAGETSLVLERDPRPAGSTALSAGLIPAAGTRWQRAAGIDDSPERFAQDIQAKAAGEADPALVASLTKEAAPSLEWLADRFALPFSLVDDFDYPGHSRRRLHGLPSRTGAELIDHLRTALEAEGIDLACDRRVTTLFAEPDGRVTGVEAVLPDGTTERIGCDRLILASNGFGGNATLVRRHLPAIADALYFGHPGNQGDALVWGEALGAQAHQLGAYQGHGNVAHPHGILITWAVITEGGCQVNSAGQRFWNEAQGYSEAARAVLAQPGGTAITIFDHRIAQIAAQFGDFQDAMAQGAIREAPTIAGIAQAFDLPPDRLAATIEAFETAKRAGATDSFGRQLRGTLKLEPPFMAVRVTGALFHTQGGLAITPDARVRRAAGGTLPNLWAVGGAAVGVSGSADSGYLSGNGLLTAVVLGRLAGAGSA